MANFVFLQARMGSTRLSGKSLMKILGRPLLAHAIDRLRLIPNIEDIIVLTTNLASDDIIEKWCKDNLISCFRGSDKNVLERYYHASMEFGATNVLRATGDNPFVEPYCAARLLESHLSRKVDYSSNKSEIGSTLPDGLGIEIFTRAALKRSFLCSTFPHHFEHVNEYILENPDDFRIYRDIKAGNLDDYSHIRLTVDTQEDFRRATDIISSTVYHLDIALDSLLEIAYECINKGIR